MEVFHSHNSNDSIVHKWVDMKRMSSGSMPSERGTTSAKESVDERAEEALMMGSSLRARLEAMISHEVGLRLPFGTNCWKTSLLFL